MTSVKAVQFCQQQQHVLGRSPCALCAEAACARDGAGSTQARGRDGHAIFESALQPSPRFPRRLFVRAKPPGRLWRLVFIDETATSTNMVRLRVRGGGGRRLVGNNIRHDGLAARIWSIRAVLLLEVVQC
jgi:hypothetical protein